MHVIVHAYIYLVSFHLFYVKMLKETCTLINYLYDKIQKMQYRIYSNKRRGVNSFGAKSLGRRLLEGGGNWRAAFISRKYRYT